MGLKHSFKSFIDMPDYINDSNYCKGYIELSKLYLGLAGTEEIEVIDKYLSQAKMKYYMGDDLGRFKGMSLEEIENFFFQKKIELLQKIPSEYADIIQTRIDRFIFKNMESAKRSKMDIPQRDKHLMISQYYNNYVIALEYLKKLEILLSNRK